MITVVAGLIRKDDKYLIAKRIYGDEPSKGKWEFPGGKVEFGEDESRAIEREIREEFSMEVRAIRYLTNSIYEFPTRTIELRLYECEYVGGAFKLTDHSDYRWVRKDELLDYDLAPADRPLAEYVTARINA